MQKGLQGVHIIGMQFHAEGIEGSIDSLEAIFDGMIVVSENLYIIILGIFYLFDFFHHSIHVLFDLIIVL